ncbi:MAG: 3-dehydroquinate synthase [Verrucomicrobiota bacterium]|nr:3-dehydroquinate synthase [Verrucomicrobiota bacterium]
MRTVQVPLDDRSYRILIGPDLMPQIGRQCRRLKLSGACTVITDEHVRPLYAKTVLNSLESAGFRTHLVSIPAGEPSKQLKMVHRCYNALAEARLDRRSFVVALGGGVVGDMAGFVAASYLRGVDFVQIPTTLLSQVDSSVGGKVGVNLKAGKNLVGAFYQPRLVLCDLDSLKTLPAREYRAGLAEVIKYGIIDDATLFRRLEKDMSKILSKDSSVLGSIIARCCQIKARVVGADEKEGGLRAILNYGHTIGHAIEAITRYGTFLHGEAISIGQVAAGILSRELTGFPEGEAARARHLFEITGLPTSLKLSTLQRKKLMDAMQLDKKVSEGKVKFVLASAIGSVTPGHTVDPRSVHAALDQVTS